MAYKQTVWLSRSQDNGKVSVNKENVVLFIEKEIHAEETARWEENTEFPSVQ